MRTLLLAINVLVMPALSMAAMQTLSNGSVEARFSDRGLSSLQTPGQTLHFGRDDFSVSIDGRSYNSSTLAVPKVSKAAGRIAYSYTAGTFNLEAEYELRPGWEFVTKQIRILPTAGSKFRVNRIDLFRSELAEAASDDYVLARPRQDTGAKTYGGFLHFGGNFGLLATAQNPYVVFERSGNTFNVSYEPDMDWESGWGSFETDRGVLAPYRLTGHRQPEKMLPEWVLGPNPSAPGLDDAEVATFTAVVRAFLLYKPAAPVNVAVGWCMNDYQLDIAQPQARTEYKRIIDSAAALGAQYLVFAPGNSEVSRREDNTDDWGWEHLLWLGMGQKIRKNEWDPSTGTIPAPLQEMLDYARGKNVKLLAYVYPVMGFTQNKEWLVPPKGTRTDVGVHAFQDWFVGALEGFMRHTGIGGFSFDHVYLGYPLTSKYAQWWGWKRIMETLRRDFPDIVIDGRQAYQLYGPWTWLAGTYPHPTGTDEQPESFVSFPDLKLDRVSADRERYTAYRYRNYEFTPSEIVPGFITHQTPRNDDTGRMPESSPREGRKPLPFRQRDWDYLGWRYSLLSSIAVAGWNNVIDMIPARDEEEFRNFSPADRNWFKHWLDWTAENKEYLRNTRPILGQPALGKVDGTSAVVGNRGFVFLFNPNGRRLDARFALDESIGLAPAGNYLVRELYPGEGRLLGKPGAGVWSKSDTVSVALDGGSATVLEIEPAPAAGTTPILFNSPGSALLRDGVLDISGIRGEAGSKEALLVALPRSLKVSSVHVDNKEVAFSQTNSGVVQVPVTFAGAAFRHYQQIGNYDPQFTGGTFTASFQVPQRIFDQLAARGKAWPIPWTSEDYRSTWLAPDRLLLFIQLAEPDDRWNASLRIDGRPVALAKAYASVRVNKRNFVGFYADISLLSADREHTLQLQLPDGLKPGQFQGAFFENVESEFTSKLK